MVSVSASLLVTSIGPIIWAFQSISSIYFFKSIYMLFILFLELPSYFGLFKWHLTSTQYAISSVYWNSLSKKSLKFFTVPNNNSLISPVIHIFSSSLLSFLFSSYSSPAPLHPLSPLLCTPSAPPRCHQ